MLELILTLLWFLGTKLHAMFLIRRRHVVLKLFVASSILILNGLLLYTLVTSRTFQLFGEMVLRQGRMIGVSPSFVRDEIEKTDQAIRAAGYTGPILFRSPYGKRFLVVPWYLARTNRPNVFWDLAPDDNPDADSETIVNRVVTNARPGSIVLLHLMYRSREASREALPGIIRGLREKGYRFVTVSELRRIANQGS